MEVIPQLRVALPSCHVDNQDELAWCPMLEERGGEEAGN